LGRCSRKFPVFSLFIREFPAEQGSIVPADTCVYRKLHPRIDVVETAKDGR
jgi:hypothetical protein